MKSIGYLILASAILAGCGPSSTTSTTVAPDGTKTTTTTTAPATPAMPAPMLSPLTQANLDKIQNDMSAAEVEAILGQPTSSQSQPIPIVGGTQTTYTYQNGASAVTIIFKNDQVKEKSGTFNP